MILLVTSLNGAKFFEIVVLQEDLNSSFMSKCIIRSILTHQIRSKVTHPNFDKKEELEWSMIPKSGAM